MRGLLNHLSVATLAVVLWAAGAMAEKVPTGLASWEDSETGAITRAVGIEGGIPICNYQKEDSTWDDIVDDWVQIDDTLWKSVRGNHSLYANATGRSRYAKGNHHLELETKWLIQFDKSDSTFEILWTASIDSMSVSGATITYHGIFPGVNKRLHNQAFADQRYNEEYEFTQEARDSIGAKGPWSGHLLGTATRLYTDSLNISGWKDALGDFEISTAGRLIDDWVGAKGDGSSAFFVRASRLRTSDSTTSVIVWKWLVKYQGKPYLVEFLDPTLTGSFPDGPLFHYASFGDTGDFGSQLSIQNRIVGLRATPSSSGTLDFMRARFYFSGGGNHDVMCAIHVYSSLARVDTTEERSLGATGWYDFDFQDGASITGSTEYVISQWASSEVTSCNSWLSASGGTGVEYDDEIYGGWPDPLVTDQLTGYRQDILCYYTEAAEGTPRRRRLLLLEAD